MQEEKGFSLIEIMLGIAIFMVGMLGIALLQISSLKNDAFSNRLAEASTLGSAKLEELSGLPYDHANLLDGDGDGTGQDTDDNEVDDDDEGTPIDNVNNFGLDDNNPAEADGIQNVSIDTRNYTILWNVADDQPVLNSKTVKVFINWTVKNIKHSIILSGIRAKEV